MNPQSIDTMFSPHCQDVRRKEVRMSKGNLHNKVKTRQAMSEEISFKITTREIVLEENRSDITKI